MVTRSRRFFLSVAPALALAIGILLLGAMDLWQSHRAARMRGEENARNLVHLLAEQTERTFQAIDLTLQGVGAVLTAHPDIPDNDAGFRDTLTGRLRTLPYVRALFAVGPDGFLVHDTGYPATPHVSVADRPYFKDHRENAKLGLHIGHPLRSRVDDTWLISFSRRLDRHDGSFGGVIVAAVDPRYFETFYHGLSVGEGGFISLLLRDGTMLARSPASEQAIGKSFAAASAAFEHLADSPHGVYWSTSPVDGLWRVVGYKALDEAPALVLVGLTQQSVLQPWRDHAVSVIAAVMALLSLIGALVYLLLRNRRRDQQEQARLNRMQRLESLGRIAGGMAHDFGNTLRIALSTLKLIRPALVNDGEARSLVDDTERFLASAMNMTQRLLAFARRQELRPRVTRIDVLIAEFAPILKQAAAPRASVEFALHTDGAACRLDPVQFEATLLNLVLNARDAMPYGGTIRITTGFTDPPPSARGPLDKQTPWVRVTVSDPGVGMSPAALEQAFDPFFTTKGPGQGTGLGLSQVHGFVRQSNGEVLLESQEGRGTRVQLLFPVVPHDDQLDGSDNLDASPEGRTGAAPGPPPAMPSGKS
jgi:two-component system, NtrC family, sensor kinase